MKAKISEEQLNKYSRNMDNNISAKNRVIAWPRMGRIDIPLKALLLSLGAKIVIPPANSMKLLKWVLKTVLREFVYRIN